MHEHTDVTIVDATEYNVDAMDWDALMAMSVESGAFYVPGGIQVDKSELEDIPHIITGVTFQTPTLPRKGATERDYITLEATVANERILAAVVERKIKRQEFAEGATIDALSVQPDEKVIYNDGSTGIRRQVIGFLASVGLITVGTPKKLPDDITDPVDLPWTMWENAGDQWKTYGSGDQERHVPYFTRNQLDRPFSIVSRRGLQKSDYASEYSPTGTATTWYIR